MQTVYEPEAIKIDEETVDAAQLTISILMNFAY
jgi:hypothetical protein